VSQAPTQKRSRKWLPDPGWTGDWELPAVLQRPVTAAERGGLVALSLDGMGPARLSKALANAENIKDVAANHMRGWRRTLGDLERMGMRAIVPSDEEYPAELAAISAPPPVLYVRGGRLDELRPMVAIVGARACTPGAARFATRLGGAFAGSGFTVVSGLARGIDGAAHRGAVDAGRSLAVTGTGLDVTYPFEHRSLAERITASGGLVSEFPPGVGPRAWHFPARNRIISGLSCATVVVEAGLGSGALITVGYALDHGRHVFACITGPENPAGAGVRDLLLDGAHLVVDSEQAVDDLIDLLDDQDYAFGRPERRDEGVCTVPPHLAKVYEAITDNVSTDDVAGTSALPAPEVAAALAELELEGLVINHRGRWMRVDRKR
jgi:DNA processing protein